MSYPTPSCVVIEPVVPFMMYLVYLELFDYSIVDINRQVLIDDLLFEPSSSRNIPALSINHDYTIRIDNIVKLV